MELVKNKFVKMDWEKSKFITGKNGKTFIAAGVSYDSAYGKIDVMFTCDTAFLFIEEETPDAIDAWTTEEIKDYLKKGYNSNFPTNFEQYVPIVDFGTKTVNTINADKYGLQDSTADMIARLNDLAEYAVEHDSAVL